MDEETEEAIIERTERFMKGQQELIGADAYTADWYRAKYPGFPDHFYPIFERFSNDQKENVDQQ